MVEIGPRFPEANLLDASLFGYGPCDIVTSSYVFAEVILKPIGFWASRFRWTTANVIGATGTLGYLDNNPVVLDKKMGRHHCKLRITGGEWCLCFAVLDEFEDECRNPQCLVERTHDM